MISRRDIVKGGVSLMSIGTTAPSLLKGTVAFAARNSPDLIDSNRKKILVLVQLAGGNDGMNTVIPIADPVYRSSRSALAVPEDDILPLDEGFGLHPSLVGMKSLWDAGHLAVVRGVGYPQQSYSHFKSMAIWQAGDPKLEIENGPERHTVAEGHGPVDAMNNALRKALEEHYPELSEIRLDDYKVRILDGKLATRAKTRVLIESSDKERSWYTIGVSDNILVASFIALRDSIKYKLLQTRGHAG